MSTLQNLSVPHKCLTAKCKGTLNGDPAAYGEWAYWHPRPQNISYGDATYDDYGWQPHPPSGLDVSSIPVDTTFVHQ